MPIFTCPDGRQVPFDTGCVFDGHWGWHNGYRVIELAWGLGFPLTDEDMALAESYDRNELDHDSTAADVVMDMVNDAEDFLNLHIEDGYYFTWDDGFYLWESEEDDD